MGDKERLVCPGGPQGPAEFQEEGKIFLFLSSQI